MTPLLEAVDQMCRLGCAQLTSVDGRVLNHTRFALLRRFARMIRERLHGVLGFIRWSEIAAAHSEGRSIKIKMLIHRGYGRHSAEAILAMITLCCSGMAL